MEPKKKGQSLFPCVELNLRSWAEFDERKLEFKSFSCNFLCLCVRAVLFAAERFR